MADGVGHDGRHRPEGGDRGPAERRSEQGRGPRRGFEPAVRDEQVLRRDDLLQERAAGRREGDAGRADHDRDDQELGEGEPAERERHGHAGQRREPGQVHGDHHRPLGAGLHPRPERERQHRADRRPHGRQQGHLGRAGVQHEDRDQGERVEGEPGAERADGVRGPQPAEPPAQRPPAHHDQPAPALRTGDLVSPPGSKRAAHRRVKPASPSVPPGSGGTDGLSPHPPVGGGRVTEPAAAG